MYLSGLLRAEGLVSAAVEDSDGGGGTVGVQDEEVDDDGLAHLLQHGRRSHVHGLLPVLEQPPALGSLAAASAADRPGALPRGILVPEVRAVLEPARE